MLLMPDQIAIEEDGGGKAVERAALVDRRDEPRAAADRRILVVALEVDDVAVDHRRARQAETSNPGSTLTSGAVDI